MGYSVLFKFKVLKSLFLNHLYTGPEAKRLARPRPCRQDRADKTVKIEFFFISRLMVYKMPRKTEFVKRKGKDKAKEHRQKCGKYDGKATRRALNHIVHVPVKLNSFS